LKLLAFKRVVASIDHYPMLYRFERMILQHARDDDANHDALYEDTRNDARRGVNESACCYEVDYFAFEPIQPGDTFEVTCLQT
jgi:hypothetical protein